ncbi:MAG: leucyl/phenylalanyl-tRNA--protein transferase [Candidatus Hydrogenedentes bacterium]|nr:leucyl/phenylalanyl-tRNA--protein transferase [Candidatus Hydrogenedentota bacterium]
MPIFRLTDELVFPRPEWAGPDGLLAVGGDLRIERLLLAYRTGIFPWYGEPDPILWWSPDPRMVLFPDEFHVSRRLRRVLRSAPFSIAMDRAFDEVIDACAATRYPGREDTWITPEMREAYFRLHEAGWAHSIECRRDGALVGGLYGISLGRCFFGESMFSRETNASKVALASLVAHARAWGFALIDCQVESPHLESLGARPIPRADFLRLLADALDGPDRTGPWQIEVPPDSA